MKLHYKPLVMTILSLCIMVAYSCGGNEIEPVPTPPQPDKVTLSTQSLTVKATETSASLTITSNRTWNASSDQPWCTLSESSGEAGTTTITLTLSTNTTNKERTATLTFKAGSATATVIVKQEGEVAKIELDNTSLNVGSNAGTANLKLTTNKDWTATSDQSWCKLSVTEGKSGSNELTITYEANPDETERTATLTFKAGSATATVIVKQEGEVAKIELDNTSLNVGSNAGTANLKLTTNKDWTATSEQNWCKLSVTEGKSGSNELTITYEANPDETGRTATLTFKAGSATATVIVKQKGEVAQIVLNNTLFNVGSNAGTVNLTLTTNRDWTASSDQSWCKLNKVSGEKGTSTITLSLSANKADHERTAILTLKAGSATAAVTIKQKEEEGKINIDNTLLNIGPDAGFVKLKLTANKNWKAIANQSWCKLSATEGQAGTFDLTITYETNPNDRERATTITINAGSATATIIIKQDMPKIKLENTSFNIGPNAGTIKLKLTTNIKWVATSDQSWCKLATTEGQSGTSDLAITYETNSDKTKRTAIIVIKASSATAIIAIKQSPNDYGSIESMPNKEWE